MTRWSSWLRLHWRLLLSALVLLAVLTWLGCAWALSGLAPDDALGQAVAPALRTLAGWCRLLVAGYGCWCGAVALETLLRTLRLRRSR